MLGRATNSTGSSTRTRLQCLCIGRARCRSSVLYCSVSVRLPPLAGVVGMAVLQNATNSKQRSGYKVGYSAFALHEPRRHSVADIAWTAAASRGGYRMNRGGISWRISHEPRRHSVADTTWTWTVAAFRHGSIRTVAYQPCSAVADLQCDVLCCVSDVAVGSSRRRLLTCSVSESCKQSRSCSPVLRFSDSRPISLREWHRSAAGVTIFASGVKPIGTGG